MPVLLLLILLHLYIGWRLVPDLGGLPGHALALQGLVLLLLLASTALIPMAFLGRRREPRAVADRWTWVGMSALGLFSMLLVLTLARDLGLLAARWLMPGLGMAAASSAAVVVLALGLTLRGHFNARRTAAVRQVEVGVLGLPAALAGWTFVQISDVHVGPTIKAAFVRDIVDAVNRLDADAVVITGDLVDGPVRLLAADVAPLAQLRARHGTFFVTGNHEYYSGAPEWIAHLRGLGLTVLLNEHVVIEQGGARLVLAGVTDWSAHHFEPAQRSDAARAIAGAPADAALRVLLAHQPRSAPAAEAAGFDLQLSGHTHGGQFWPWNLAVPLQQPFVSGLKRLGRMSVYTSRGTGYWGPPLRLGAPSEITRIRLVRR
jgi:predicted MPP superfamily phosphohydrolase